MNASPTQRVSVPADLVTHLRTLAATRPTDTALIVASAEAETSIQYGELDRRVRALAAELQARFEPGDRALLLLDNNEHYVVGFLGCLYAGLIAVPAFPPESLREHHIARLKAIAHDADARCVLTSSDLFPLIVRARDFLQNIEPVVVDAISPEQADRWVRRSPGDRDIIFLQYTSGSTAAPKGVIVDHGNLLANEAAIRGALETGPGDVFVSWLPLFHDMGLVGGLFQPIYCGIPLVLMSPAFFLEQPLRWLEWISRHRGTISGGPDFAYRLCLERISDAQIRSLDLSSWRVAFSGAEPVRHDTLTAFAERFRTAGFDARALYPCYGLAEATLFVTGGYRDSGLTTRICSTEGLAKGRASTSKQGRTLVGCGVTHGPHRVRIADTETGEKQSGARIGEIWVSGPSISRGYWKRDEETAETFVEQDGERWLRTGDLGFVHDKQLYIAGRQKDLIILRGHNVYPQDIERAIEAAIEAVRKGRVAAFAVQADAGESVGVAVEVSRGLQKLISPERLFEELSAAVASVCNEPLHVAVLLNPGALPKTSSGKVQRSACRKGWLDGTLDAYATLERGVSRAESPGGTLVESALTQTQRRISAIWADVLRIPAPSSAGADFFAVGGNSITAAQVTARVSQEFAIDVGPRALLEARTIAAFAESVEQAPRLRTSAIARVVRAQQMPPSAAQRRMWFLWQLQPNTAAYNVGGGLRLRGPLDLEALQRTLAELVRRHEVLRTRFQQRDGVLVQVIDEPQPVAIDVVDLPALPQTDRSAQIDALLLTEFQKSFDLQAGPLVRATLLKLDPGDHVLFVTTHHIAADGTSMALLMEDVVALYGAFRDRRTPDKARSSLQYIDYAAWHEDELARGGRDRQLAYWKEQLGKEYPDVSPHPDRPRPAHPEPRGERYSFPIDPPLMGGIRSLASAQGVTVFVVLLTAWKIVLARHSGQHDIRVGAPVANRRGVESESIVGPFINTVVMRTRLDGNPTVTQLLRRVGQTVVDAQAHQDLPFEELVEALAGDRTSARHPLFQVMHNHQCRTRTTFEELAPLQVEAFDGPLPTTEFDLSLNTEEQGAQIRASLKYLPSIYDEATVARIARHWLNVLRAMVGAPDAQVDDLSLLSQSERTLLVQTFNDTAKRYPEGDSSVHRLIERQARQTPDAEAVVFEGTRYSYRELNRRANRLAWKLREEAGVGPDVVVGVCCERSLELVVGLLAILKAGGAYLPLDPVYPQSRLQFILEDAKPRLVLAGRAVLDRLPTKAGSEAWLLDEEHSEASANQDLDLPGALHPFNLVYCLYTSGSTGKPKCAANTQGALLNQILWRQELYALKVDDRVLHKTPIGFDVSVWELFWPLMTGATLVVASPGAHRDPWRLRTVIEEERVTTLHFVPPMLTAFIEAGELARCGSLRRVFVGGQALAMGTQEAFVQQCAAKLYHLYGPTESAIDVSHWECKPGARDPVIPMGRALANTQLYVLDHALEPVPIGVVGELYIAGVQLARGYTDRPGLTASQFLANPFARGERLYRSGDLARYRADGALEYVGRIDHQVKVRGFRIELGEIEARLREHPSVREAVLLVSRDRFGENEIVAHVSLNGPNDTQAIADNGETQAQLQDHLAQRLPDYMLPAHYAWHDALPLLGNGKIDRLALSAYKPTSEHKPHAPPRTELECRLAAIWGEVLEIANVGLRDSFFELGGHSLLATRLVSRVRAAFDIELPLRTLFEATRLGEFAEEVRKRIDHGARNGLGAIELVDRSRPLPLSYAQQRMWLLWQLDPQNVAYNLAGAVKLSGPLRYVAIEDTLRALVGRHETLRTTFRILDGIPVQNIASHVEIPVQRMDLRALSTADQQAAVRRHVQSEAHRPFDLQTGPLLRVLLLQLEEREHVMVVTTHHIVAEGWTVDVFAREFMELYDGFCKGQPAQLPPLPVQYADYMHWHQRWLDGGELQRQLTYWKAQLAGENEVIALPTDRPRPKVMSSRGDVHRFLIAPALAQRLRAFSVQQGLTLFMTLLAGFFALLYRYSGQRDLRVGFPVANRLRPEAEGLIGAFLNMQVIRCEIEDAMSFRQLLAQVKEATIGAQSHQDLPFDRLVDAIKPPRGLGFHPLYQVMFNLHRWNFERRAQMGEVSVEVLPGDLRAAQIDLMLDVGDVTEALDCCLTYSTDLFDRTTMERLSASWVELLDRATACPDERVGSVPIVADADRAQLETWGRNAPTPGEVEAAEAVHRVIERQARVRPESVALILAEEELSYAELNRRANQLAHRLISLGVGPETKVGIALGRSADMVTSILAVLKAGGAYVPLDPQYPAPRLSYMMRDSGVEVLLTQASVAERLPSVKGVAQLHVDAGSLHDESADDPDVPVNPGNLAYVIYTSGSTGQPKGIGIPHHALAAHTQVAIGYFGLTPADRMLQFSTMSFDAFVEQLFPPLCAGAAVVLRGETLWDSETFYRELHDKRITIADLPTAYWFALSQDFRECGPRSYAAWRQVQATGEAMPPEGVRNWREAGLAGVKLLNTYGPTETAVTATAFDCSPWVERLDEVPSQVPIGTPLGGRAVHVLDTDLNLSPRGVAGELYIGGALLARGYHARAMLTAERFVADPFSTNGERLYRTGDRVRWNSEGQLEFLGRMDQQVKVRGFRIELKEIEAQLLAQPEVSEAVVIARNGPDGTQLVGYVVSSGAALDVSTIRERLARELPDYMLPSAIVVMESLPLTPNGKLDRKALPEAELPPAGHYEAPQGEVEETLATIWSEVLGIARIGRHDDFFELGGHSLRALTVIGRLRAKGMTASVRMLFQHPQLAAFAQSVEQEREHAEVSVPPNLIPRGCQAIQPEMLTLIELDAEQIRNIEAAVPGGAVNIQDIYPLVALQEGILFHHTLQSQGDVYILTNLLSFDSRERLDRFVVSFNKAIERHDILRTAVLWEGLKEPVQVVHRRARLEIEWLEDGAVEATSQEGMVTRLKAHVDPRCHRMDVRKAPMLRAVAAPDAEHGRWLLQLLSHHLVLDHETQERLIEEIALIQQGREFEMPEPVPFRRFVAQARRQAGQGGHEAFFRSMLSDVDEPTAPFGVLDVNAGGGDIEEVRFRLEETQSLRIRQQARKQGVSAAALFHLAFALVLGKLTNRNDVVFGTVLFGRMQGVEGVECAMGMFNNTLPVRIKLGARGIEPCLRETHDALTQLMHHEHASLSTAQRCSNLPAGTPLFSALMNCRHSARRQAVEGSGSWEGMEVLGSEERTNYPLTLSVDDLGHDFELAVQASRSVGAGRLCEYLNQALTEMVTALAYRARSLACELRVSHEDELTELHQWGVNSERYPWIKPVHRLIEDRARRRSAETALVFGEGELTYGELNARANRLAHRLRSLGAKPETPVGIAVERSLEMVVGLLAILKAGAAYVPLDPEYPAERLRYMQQDSGIRLLLTQSALAARLPAVEHVVTLSIDTVDLSDEPQRDPLVPLHADNLAYVIYTSGSTGKPKAAANRHGSLCNRLAWMQDAYGLSETDVVLQKTPFSFDVSVWEFFWPLMQGARLVIAEPGAHREPHRLVELIRRHVVSTVHFVPSMLQAFLEHPGAASCTSLRRIVCSGEALSIEAQAKVFARLPSARLYNLYGPTEAAIDVTHWTCAQDDRGTVPIGRPIADTRTVVLDTALNPLPPEVAGELYLGGAGLARGYLGRSGLTAERFVADPLSANGERLYRTGDLVRWSREGHLEYLGRIDHQVKIRGLRIEPGEIESQLLAQPEVREATVVCKDGHGGPRLVAYVVGHSSAELDSSALRERLSRVLPDYMVPSAIMVLEGLPLNANGKLDRKALPDPEHAEVDRFEAPQGQIEEALAAIWSEVLGIQRIGRHDNFFLLGGHSLLAMELSALVRHRHGLELPVRVVFERPTLAALAEASVTHGDASRSRSRQLETIEALLSEME